MRARHLRSAVEVLLSRGVLSRLRNRGTAFAPAGRVENCWFQVDVLLRWDDAVLAVQQDVFPGMYIPLRARLRSVIR